MTVANTSYSFIWNFGYFKIINSFFNSFLMSMIIVSLFSTIVSFVCDIIEKSIPPIILICDVIILIIGFLVFHIIRKQQMLKSQLKLDMIESESDYFNELKITPFYSLSLAIDGFVLGHQFVLSWEFFRLINHR